MKRLIMLLSVLAFFAVSAAAQDFVTKRNGEDIAAIVDEVGPDYVRFRLWDEPDGVTYTMLKNEILMIRYATGRNEVFDQMSSLAVAPMMKYKEMAKVYDYRLYQKSLYDRYSPVGSGIASFFIPGLGQMICGEWGRGFAYLGGHVGCYMLTGISAIAESDTLVLMGIAGLLAIDICAIVDGVRVAKVKNMYMEDLRKSGYYGLDVDLYPSVNYVRTTSGVQPTAGMTLALRF
ncbi:MAG: hypothetical protein J6Q37_01610 [Bacteroidales bacterium]|nr:hypothetical protein [Bacteroidales bacterium]